MNYSKVQRLVHKLRKKYSNSPAANEQLSNIIWFSFPIVYPSDFHKRALADLYKENKRYYRALKYAREMSLCTAFDFVLITLTFSDDSLDFQSEKTRKQYVSRFLNENCIDYIACVDYGKKNFREHYHAIALVEPRALFLSGNIYYKFCNDWPGGFHLVSHISNNSNAAIKYAMKAVRYAFKSNGKVFHKRKPYRSKLPFNYIHNDWIDFDNDNF